MPTKFWAFHKTTLRRVPRLFYADAGRADKMNYLLGVLFAVVLFFLPELASLKFPRWWGLVVLGFLLLRAVSDAYYLRFSETESEVEKERKERMRLEEAAKPTLEIVYDPSRPRYRRIEPLNDADHPTAVTVYLQIGIINRGTQVAEGVRVDVAELEPLNPSYLPVALRRIHELYAGESSPYERFDVSPTPAGEPTEYIMVAFKRSAGHASKHISMCYSGTTAKPQLDVGEYHLKIVAHGRHRVPVPCEKWFRMWADGDGLLHLADETKERS